ncbi:MAG: thiamine pyrophosphate-dependent enzyme [Acidobacteriota bacterium]|nr:thiamine pyrophosphate-dependent enzyme [Acidobacteriota bacterium]
MATKTRSLSQRSSKPKKTGVERPFGVQAETAKQSRSASDHELLRKLYSGMLKRQLEAGESRGIGKQRSAAQHIAVLVGATAELDGEDTVIAPGDNAAGNQPDPFKLATGMALSCRLEKRRQVAVAIRYDANEIEPWHEAFRFAGIHKLPVIFVLSNDAADLSFIEKHSNVFDDVGLMAREYGFPGVIVDGNDVVAIWRVVQESIHRARVGAGPTLVECQIGLPGSQEPLAHLEHYMRARNAWDERWKRGMVAKLTAESRQR